MNISSTITSGLAKGAGYVGLAAVVYDAHKNGQVVSQDSRRNGIANDALDAYMDTKQLDSGSHIMNKIQNWRKGAEMKNLLFNGPRNFVKSAVGYVKGFCNSLVSNVVPLALSALTVVTKGAVSKAAATALTAYGATSVAKNAFGAGSTRINYLK